MAPGKCWSPVLRRRDFPPRLLLRLPFRRPPAPTRTRGRKGGCRRLGAREQPCSRVCQHSCAAMASLSRPEPFSPHSSPSRMYLSSRSRFTLTPGRPSHARDHEDQVSALPGVVRARPLQRLAPGVLRRHECPLAGRQTAPYLDACHLMERVILALHDHGGEA